MQEGSRFGNEVLSSKVNELVFESDSSIREYCRFGDEIMSSKVNQFVCDLTPASGNTADLVMNS